MLRVSRFAVEEIKKFLLAAAKSSLTATYNFITDSYDAGLQENNDYNTLNKIVNNKNVNVEKMAQKISTIQLTPMLSLL